MADADRLEDALDALIENAVNHTVDSDTIEVAIRRRDARAAISVRDTGAGIPAPDLDQIFARFARADPGRSRHTGNFGLGLSIVKAIVDAHGGEVHVASAVGVETTFEILLPLSPVVIDRPERTSRQGTAGLAPASTLAGALDADGREHDV
jgi:signal transduction histidine kinase